MAEEKTYWVHRTSMGPLLINYNAAKNGLPILLTWQQWLKLREKDFKLYDSVYFPLNEFLPEDPTGYEFEDAIREIISLLEEAGISREQYLEILKKNYEEQLDKFFENGLYCQRETVDTTATKLGRDWSLTGKIITPEEDAKKILSRKNLGFNQAGTRDPLNLALFLEIPTSCIEPNGEILPVFEKATTPLETLTAYFGLREIDKVIPTQYIKCAVVVNNGERLVFDNPYFDANYIIENGIYDGDALEKYISWLKDNYNFEKIKNIVTLIIKNNYSKSWLENIITILETHNGRQEQELISIIKGVIYTTERAKRKPEEIERDNILECNLENLEQDEVVSKIKTFLVNIKALIKQYNNACENSKFWDAYKCLQQGLNVIMPSVLKKIEMSNEYNNIVGEIGVLKNIFKKQKEISDEDAEAMVEMYTAEGELKTKLEKDRKKCENEITFIKYAASADSAVAQKILCFIQTNDVTNLSYEECISAIKKIEKSCKPITKK